jgi:hypothetical protein
MKPMLADTSDTVAAVLERKPGPPRHHRSFSDCDIAAEQLSTTGLRARKSEGNLLLHAEEEVAVESQSREDYETDKQEIAVYWSKTPVRLQIAQEAIQQKIYHRNQLQNALEAADWCQVLTIVEEHPYLKHDLSFEFIVQGERCYGLPLHVAICEPSCPQHIVQLMLSSHALATPETRRGRLPLHLALLRDAKAETIDLVLGSSTTSLTRPDSLGYVALHYAVEFARPEIVGTVLRACPQAAGVMTYRRRYPLHLAAAERSSCFDGDALDMQILRELIDAFPSALQFPEMQGRLPLHLACANPFPKWDFLQVLIDAFPPALLDSDKCRKTPLDLLKQFAASSGEQNVVRSFLQDRTNAERRRRKTLIFNKLWRRGSRPQKPENEDSTLTNLMNCYG